MDASHARSSALLLFQHVLLHPPKLKRLLRVPDVVVERPALARVTRGRRLSELGVERRDLALRPLPVVLRVRERILLRAVVAPALEGLGDTVGFGCPAAARARPFARAGERGRGDGVGRPGEGRRECLPGGGRRGREEDGAGVRRSRRADDGANGRSGVGAWPGVHREDVAGRRQGRCVRPWTCCRRKGGAAHIRI
jgi:hypothetical protein